MFKGRRVVRRLCAAVPGEAKAAPADSCAGRACAHSAHATQTANSARPDLLKADAAPLQPLRFFPPEDFRAEERPDAGRPAEPFDAPFAPPLVAPLALREAAAEARPADFDA